MNAANNVVPLQADGDESASLDLCDGANVRVDAHGHCMELRASDGQVIVSYSAVTGKASIHASSGVEVHTEGTLEIGGADRVRISANRSLELSAPERVQVCSDGASLEFDHSRAVMRSRSLQAIADEATFSLQEVTVGAQRVATAIKSARHFVGTVDIRAGRIVERATNVFREVEGLYQTRAERLRSVARGAFQVVARRTTLRAEEDMTLMGEKIHLA